MTTRLLGVAAADLEAMGVPMHLLPCLIDRRAWFVVVLRHCERLRSTRGPRRLGYLLVRLYFDRLSESLGFDIPLGVFGPGLSIAHRGTIVVNGDARVGGRCRIHPGVTIGAVHGAAPKIGDDVFLGPNAGVFGDVTIGDRCVLGPHALVNFDLAPGTTVVAQRATVLDRRRGAQDRVELP